MFPGAYTASMVGGAVSGMIVGDVLGSVATPANVPATSASVVPKATADGTPVSGAVTPRQTVFTSAAIVVGALAVLLLGSRVFKNARIA